MDNVKVGALTLLPAERGTCEECAGVHLPGSPHNKQSLQYQYHFFGRNGRWPTWEDAMAHCTPDVKRRWREALLKRGQRLDAAPTGPVFQFAVGLPRVLLVTCGKWRRAYPMAWTPDVYYQGDSMHPAWKCVQDVVPEGCTDVVFFQEWLASHLYEGGPEGVGRLRCGRQTVVVEVLNGSVFERI
jgi:hypothetical protein